MNKLKSAAVSLIAVTVLFFTTMYPPSDFNIIHIIIYENTAINKVIENENVFGISFDIGICLLLGFCMYWLLRKLIFKS